MSRCFPFPPPGYEERLGHRENLLREEKLRDKKLKKEKKDREKREGKDKRKREKGDGRHKEKKDKKEKHRDKKDKHKGKKDKKDKDNKRNDNEKSSISEDAGIVRELETRSTEKVHTGVVCFVDKGSHVNKTKFASLCQRQDEQEYIDHSLNGDTAESQFLEEVGRRIRDEGRATASTLGRSSAAYIRGKEEISSGAYVRGNASASTLGRSSAAYIRGNEEISSGAYVRGNEEMHKSALRDLQSLAGVKARSEDRRVDQRQEEYQVLQDGEQYGRTAIVRDLARSVDSKVEGVSGSVHDNIDRKVQWTPKCKEDGDHKRGEQGKCKDKKEKKNHVKDRGRKNEKLKERTDNKSRDQEMSKILYKIGSPRYNSSNSCLSETVDTKAASTEENVKKRNHVEAKGLVPENEFRQNKLPRVTLYLPKDNGHIACKSLGLLDSDKKGIPLQDKEDINNCEVSGTVDAPSSLTSTQISLSSFARSCQLMKDSIEASPADKMVKESTELQQASLVVEASVKRPTVDKVIKMSRKSLQGYRVVEGSKKHHHVDEISEPSRKSPHPDMKYLNQVLKVPERMEWSEVDNEDWLFSGKDPLFQKPKHDVSASCDYGQQQVWSETLHVESADIYAMPYVIPY